MYDHSLHKLAKLMLNLERWNVRQAHAPTTYLQQSCYAEQYEAYMELIGMAGYVHEGHVYWAGSRLVVCACCGIVHQLPCKSTMLVVYGCATCHNQAENGIYPTYSLYRLGSFMPAASAQLKLAILDVLADEYFTQLNQKGIDT